MKDDFPTPVAKRAFDVVVSLMLILLTSWIMLLIVVAYWLTGNSPAFFIQPRIGKGNRIFVMYKFRTLNQPGSQPFRLGNFLRATSLDELPQLFQVLAGQLSLVGPRPLLVDYAGLFSEEQLRRHDVLPGITGWAQVNGRNEITWQRKLELDVWYVDHWSFWLDIRILFKTLVIIFSFRPDVSLQESKFTGNKE
jgi:lipopolysaccharide/colanic/teichoic acid biosynthesis glycosyltransferase